MKNIFKRAAAGILALAMCAGLSGCYSEDKAWAAKVGDETMPIGGYIYYLSSAYSQGAAQVGTDGEVLNGTIEDKSASQWIQDEALEYLRSYYFVSQKFDELGLSLDEDDQAAIGNATSSVWSYYKDSFEKMGISEDSFQQAYALYNIRLEKVMAAMYGEGGEMALPETEMHDYYTDNYVYYNYFFVAYTDKDEETGVTSPKSDEDKAAIKEDLEDHIKQINDGDETLSLAAVNYANATQTEPNIGEPVAMRSESMSEMFLNAMKDLENGQAGFAESDSGAYVIQKLDIEEDFQALVGDESRKLSLTAEMKGDEFTDYIAEQSANVNVELNQKAIGSVKLSTIADTLGKNGTSSTESSAVEDEGGSSEGASAESGEESSEESSGESSEESEG